MCGIVGLRRFDGGAVDEGLLRRMCAQLVHRGPDDEGFWIDPVSASTGFGHRRLAIIDVAGSRQPMSTRDGRMTVTFNGEIFNYRELRRACRYDFTTSGDTEVLLALHRLHGPRAVERLRGQFAYAVHDGDDLWLFRDRLGVLPLYYYVDHERFAFASEIKALLPALPAPPRVDEASLDAYLAGRAVPAPFTLFAGVRKLLPGHRLRVAANGDTDLQSYWRLPEGVPEPIDADDAIARVVDGVRSAVAQALVADVPVGSLLSGGVDSSLIVALATDLRDGDPVDTFSAGFGDPRFDELPFARDVSARFGTRHHEVVVEPARFADLWRLLTWHRDAPISEPADVAVYELATLASRSVKVLLSGEGSDELFAGYPKYQFAALGSLAGAVPAALRRPAFGAVERALPARLARGRIAVRALAAPTETERLGTWFAPFTAEERSALLHDVAVRPTRTVAARGHDPVDRMLRYDTAGWLPDNLLERGDRMAMAASVEVRPPFLDHELVELAFRLPSDVKVRHGETKWVLKQAARTRLPASIVDRRKVGFRVPLDSWFRGNLRELANDALLGPRSFVGDVLDRAQVASLLRTHEVQRRDESMRIWTLLSLEIWHEVFFGHG